MYLNVCVIFHQVQYSTTTRRSRTSVISRKEEENSSTAQKEEGRKGDLHLTLPLHYCNLV